MYARKVLERGLSKRRLNNTDNPPSPAWKLGEEKRGKITLPTNGLGMRLFRFMINRIDLMSGEQSMMFIHYFDFTQKVPDEVYTLNRKSICKWYLNWHFLFLLSWGTTKSPRDRKKALKYPQEDMIKDTAINLSNKEERWVQYSLYKGENVNTLIRAYNDLEFTKLYVRNLF